MSDATAGNASYFVFGFPLSGEAWQRYLVGEVLPDQIPSDPDLLSFEIRCLADNITNSAWRQSHGEQTIPAEVLLALRTLDEALRYVARQYFLVENPGGLARGQEWANQHLGADITRQLFQTFCALFPPLTVALGDTPVAEFLASDGERTILEMILLFMNVNNPATAPAAALFDDSELQQNSSFAAFITGLEHHLETEEAPGSEGLTIFNLLRAPALASPTSLSGQLEWMRLNWAHLLPASLLRRLQSAVDVLQEVDLSRSPEYGPPPVLEFPATGSDEPEPEAFSCDADWMRDVVLMAKSVYVWLDQLGRDHGHKITRLDEVPDAELDRLAGWGVTGLWLIGLWQRADSSRQIKQQMGNAEAAASAYALDDYRIADDLGGEDAWLDLSERAGRRGIRLASDMVPNHMGMDSRWVREHPEYFLQLPQPPYPAYRFTGPDLCDDPNVSIRLEDGYWDHSDAAVVFQRVDNNQGNVTYIYHGNDGTSMPWNDTAQLNFLMPEVREAVTQVILAVARRFPIIRFDAAMTLAKKHYQRLWFPAPGDAGAIPSRAEHGLDRPAFDAVFPTEFWRDVVDRVAQEAPDTLLLAEAFWLMEGYFVRTLGMHRVYNSAFMNMLKMEDNQSYRQTISNVLEFSPEILQRFVNFMNNPDERTAVEQFGKGDKYFGCALMLVTMPGLPMLGHGQVEGFSEKYGMEYRKAYWDEPVDQDLVARHERDIFPLMRRRHLFSGAENFALFNFEEDHGGVNENVFAYSNRADDEAVLVLYNNSYEQTSGRVRQSTAINTGSAEATSLVWRSLGEALNLDADPGVWYIFRDPIRHEEYIRRGAELAYEGFVTHLNGYEYRVLLDFERVHDSAGRWEEVAGRLHGHGTASIRHEVRRLNLVPQCEALRSWVSAELLAYLEWPETGAAAAAAYSATDLPPVLATSITNLLSVQDQKLPQTAGSLSEKELAELCQGLPGSRIPQAVYLAAVIEILAGSAPRTADTPDGFLGLEPADTSVLVGELHDLLVQWTGHDFAGHSTVHLAEFLAHSKDYLGKMARGETRWLCEALDKPSAIPCLGLNQYQGEMFLNSEALSTYLQAMVLYGLTTNQDDSLVGLLDARALIENTAEAAGYALAAIKTSLG